MLTKYKSQGTVSFGARSTDVWINFVPHGDYFAKHKGKNYAVFFGDDDHHIVKECRDESGRSIEIRSSGTSAWSEQLMWDAAKSAAASHSKVEVEVLMSGAALKLTSITIPAK